MKKFIFLLCLFLGFFAGGFAQKKQTKSFKAVELKRSDLYTLRNRMIGVFTSERQSSKDPHYLSVQMVMKPIWSDRHDGYWMYVEQAEVGEEAKPYRQRLYHLYRLDKTTIVSEVYEIHNPQRFANKWENDDLFEQISPESLRLRTGCEIHLHKNEFGQFWGSTSETKECTSSVNNAAYVVSDVLIDETKMISWDRGFNKNDQQVWGAYKGGYEFVRVSDDVVKQTEDENNTNAFPATQPIPQAPDDPAAQGKVMIVTR